jgi:hypothetical protein
MTTMTATIMPLVIALIALIVLDLLVLGRGVESQSIIEDASDC